MQKLLRGQSMKQFNLEEVRKELEANRKKNQLPLPKQHRNQTIDEFLNELNDFMPTLRLFGNKKALFKFKEIRIIRKNEQIIPSSNQKCEKILTYVVGKHLG